MALVLAIDSGNTMTNFALMTEDAGHIVCRFASSRDEKKTGHDYFSWFFSLCSHEKIKLSDISGVVISSVVPRVLRNLVSFGQILSDNVVIASGENPRMKPYVEAIDPNQVGADLLVGAYYVAKEHKGKPAILINCGTATTASYITSAGQLKGCIIAPGFETSLQSLCSSAALLPQMTFDAPPEKGYGTSTVECVRLGVYYGFLGLVKTIIEEMGLSITEETGHPQPQVNILLTGGYSHVLHLPDFIEKKPDLLLRGLWHFYSDQKSEAIL